VPDRGGGESAELLHSSSDEADGGNFEQLAEKQHRPEGWSLDSGTRCSTKLQVT